jgi:hypothetical protein
MWGHETWGEGWVFADGQQKRTVEAGASSAAQALSFGFIVAMLLIMEIQG